MTGAHVVCIDNGGNGLDPKQPVAFAWTIENSSTLAVTIIWDSLAVYTISLTRLRGMNTAGAVLPAR